MSAKDEAVDSGRDDEIYLRRVDESAESVGSRRATVLGCSRGFLAGMNSACAPSPGNDGGVMMPDGVARPATADRSSPSASGRLSYVRAYER